MWEHLHPGYERINWLNGGDIYAQYWNHMHDSGTNLYWWFLYDPETDKVKWQCNKGLPESPDDQTLSFHYYLPTYDTPLKAAMSTGHYVTMPKYQAWLESLPKGYPLADIEFFKLFNKPLPPLAPLHEFLPWAAKEDLLPWSPFV
jgi:hypothetical protein